MRQILDNEVDAGNGLPPAGWHRVEVRTCEEKHSKNGNDYYSVELVDPLKRKLLAYDNVMLSGNATGMGLRKLRALGAATRNAEDTGWDILPPAQVVGKSGYASLVHEEYEWDGTSRTRVVVSIKDGECGYHPNGEPPAGFVEDDETVPF